MQKLFYLPEAHTDFLFSILAEELGLIGAITVIALFLVMIWRALAIGRAAEEAGQLFGAQIAYGISVWLGLQACVNIGVNMGVLPTKGLTLPLMSYGGSSLVIVCVAIGLLLRVDLETRQPEKASARVKR
jgi:cell division protein FtsW